MEQQNDMHETGCDARKAWQAPVLVVVDVSETANDPVGAVDDFIFLFEGS